MKLKIENIMMNFPSLYRIENENKRRGKLGLVKSITGVLFLARIGIYNIELERKFDLEA